MSALAPLAGMPVAFKLGTVLGVFLLPLLAYASFRLMRLAFPAPLLGAAAALVFLYLEDNPIWGGTIASTLTGEFSYTYGVGFAVLFLGVLFRARADGRGPWAPAAVLALTSYAHGYAVLWAGLTASGLLLWDPATRAGGAGAPGGRSAGCWRSPRWPLPSPAPPSCRSSRTGAGRRPSTTPGSTSRPAGFFPPLLWPLLLAGALALAATLARRARGGRADERLAAARLRGARGRGARLGRARPRRRRRALRPARAALAGPRRGGRPRPRPRAARPRRRGGARPRAGRRGARRLALARAAPLGRLELLRARGEGAVAGLAGADAGAARRPGDPRVAFEYGPVHERAGSIRMHETVPFFSGRSGIEGVYNQSSTTTHPVYYLLSELFPSSPNPFRSRTYSRFDPEAASRGCASST